MKGTADVSDDALEENARLLEAVLSDFGIRGRIVAVRPGPPDHAEAELPAEVWIETGLDAEEFHTLTDPTWLQVLRAESFGIQETPRPFAATAGAPQPQGIERHALTDDTRADEATAIERERTQPPHRRRRVRRRDE